MEVKALLILLMLTCWLQQSGGTCTLQLTLLRGSEKIDLNLVCPSCQFSGTTLDVTDSCDAYSDLDLESECTDANEECSKIYFLQNHSISSSNTKTKVPVVETVTVTVTETITTDTLMETTTVMSIETTTPLYLQSTHPTISVPNNDHCSNSQGDIKKGSSREKVLGALLALFVVLFIIMTVGWMWSYWRTKGPRTSLTMETAQARVNELNYDTIPTDEVLLQLQNCSVSGPTTLQLHTNQAYESQQTCHSSDEPIYETIPIEKTGQREMIKTVGCQQIESLPNH